jgi:hypothetical protein
VIYNVLHPFRPTYCHHLDTVFRVFTPVVWTSNEALNNPRKTKHKDFEKGIFTKRHEPARVYWFWGFIGFLKISGAY